MIKTLNFDGEFVTNVYVADTFFKRLLGYMFRKKPHYDAIMITPCSSIHTFFMKFNIDVLFVDENMNVISVIKDLKPWKVILPVKGAKMVIEAEAGRFAVKN